MKYKLLADYGNQEFDQSVGGRHGLKAGSIGTLVDEVSADTQGAHNDREDAYVLEFDDEARTIAKDGSLQVIPIKRRIAFAASLFSSDHETAEQYAAHVEANPDHAGPLFEVVA